MIQTGVVKKWFEHRNFGFITPDDQSTDELYVQANVLNGDRCLRKGEMVEFTCRWSHQHGKFQAVSCRRITSSTAGADKAEGVSTDLPQSLPRPGARGTYAWRGGDGVGRSRDALIEEPRNNSLRSLECREFRMSGQCRLGMRCRFLHRRDPERWCSAELSTEVPAWRGSSTVRQDGRCPGPEELLCRASCGAPETVLKA